MYNDLPVDDGQAVSLRRTSLREQAIRVIRAEIIAGSLVPDTVYTIGQTAERLGVSATPVREALIDLARQGLVEVIRNRGFQICVVTDGDLDQIVEIRCMLEVPAIERLTLQTPPPDVSDLQLISERIDAAAEAGDLVGFLALDRDLHLSLLGKLGNPRLVEIVGRLRDQTRLYGLWQLVGAADLIDTAREHDALLDAVASGNAPAAVAIMARHLEHTRGLWAGRNR